MRLISADFIEAGKSDRGGWSRKQIELLGISWPPQQGWQSKLVGGAIAEADAQLFLDLKNKHIQPSDDAPLFQNVKNNTIEPLIKKSRAEIITTPQTRGSNPSTIVYTDGACLGNPGIGGWAAILQYDSQTEEISGGEPHTTNNRMEMTAAIEALKALTPRCKVKLHSDSQLLVNTMTRHWKRKANQDLWEELDRLVRVHDVEWIWVKGHANDPLNNQVDKLAVAAAKKVQRLNLQERVN